MQEDSVTKYERTVAAWSSPLWRLLTRKLLVRSELLVLKADLFQELQLFEADEFDFSLAHYGLTDEPFITQVSPDEFAQSLERLDPGPSLDWLAMLCVLYRLALDEVDLPIAVELQCLIRRAYRQLLDHLEIERFGLQGAKELVFLVEMRVLRGDTSSGPPEWALKQAQDVFDDVDRRIARENPTASSTDRRAYPTAQVVRRHKIVEAAIGFALGASRTNAPVVRRSERTLYLATNRGRLRTQLLETVNEQASVQGPAASNADLLDQ